MNASSTVISSLAPVTPVPSNVVRKNRSPAGAPAGASPSPANHIHEAPSKSRVGSSAAGAPIQRAVQSDACSRPVSNQVGLLQSEPPRSAQVPTRQK